MKYHEVVQAYMIGRFRLRCVSFRIRSRDAEALCAHLGGAQRLCAEPLHRGGRALYRFSGGRPGNDIGPPGCANDSVSTCHV